MRRRRAPRDTNWKPAAEPLEHRPLLSGLAACARFNGRSRPLWPGWRRDKIFDASAGETAILNAYFGGSGS